MLKIDERKPVDGIFKEACVGTNYLCNQNNYRKMNGTASTTEIAARAALVLVVLLLIGEIGIIADAVSPLIEVWNQLQSL